ncbi:MAG TPA: hypothetical protein VM365_02615 [Gemmatimonadales bacterium]|nr:hypothetical protein [Gemmatimonadales bacterium]
MRRLLLLALLTIAPATVAAQASQFGVRGLGVPGRPFSTRAAGSSGAFAMFDAESGLNPATIGGLPAMTATFNSSASFRTVENPAGSASLRSTRFPYVSFGGPARGTPFAVGVSYSTYTNRDFSNATVDTLELRDALIPVFDTLSSRGGMSDLRIAGSFKARERSVIGGSFHILTGSNRMQEHRTFTDNQYRPVRQSTELSFAGVGLSLGAVHQLGRSLWVAAIARSDGGASVERDSAPVGDIDLPYSLGLGLRWKTGARLDLAAHGIFRTWSGANSDLLALGGSGSDNTVELAFGGEFLTDPRRANRAPIRFGVYYASLPFLLPPGLQPEEYGASLGSGVRFAQDRGSLDFAVGYLSRSAGDFDEHGFTLSFGVAVRP